MKYLVEKFYFDSGSNTLNLPDEYEPIGSIAGYIIARKLVAHSNHKAEGPPRERKEPVSWVDQVKDEHAKKLATHWENDDEPHDYSGIINPEYEGPFHPDDLDYVKEEEPLTINPVDRILLENLNKEVEVRGEESFGYLTNGVFRHCEECDNLETIFPIEGSYGMFTSSLDFCTRCEKPWGMGMEKDAWAEGQMMPGVREGIQIEAPDPIPYMCILCSYKSETFATTGAECEIDEDGMHDWMLEDEYWDMVAEHQDIEHQWDMETEAADFKRDDPLVSKPCIFCQKAFEDHGLDTHGYEPRERCKWCTLDEHMHTNFMHEYEILTEPGPNRGHCIKCGTFNDSHTSWCKAIPKRVKAQQICPTGRHDDISMHLCECVEEETFINPNTGHKANTLPAERQKTDYQVDGGREANAKAYANQYGTKEKREQIVDADLELKARIMAETLAQEAQRGDQPRVRCPSCQQDQMSCNCA